MSIIRKICASFSIKIPYFILFYFKSVLILFTLIGFCINIVGEKKNCCSNCCCCCCKGKRQPGNNNLGTKNNNPPKDHKGKRRDPNPGAGKGVDPGKEGNPDDKSNMLPNDENNKSKIDDPGICHVVKIKDNGVTIDNVDMKKVSEKEDNWWHGIIKQPDVYSTNLDSESVNHLRVDVEENVKNKGAYMVLCVGIETKENRPEYFIIVYTGIKDMERTFSSDSDAFYAAILEAAWITSTSYMFTDCKNFKYVKVSGFKDNEVKNMSHMFYGCENLKNVEFNVGSGTAEVNSMRGMFSSCTNLSELRLIEFNTCEVTNMENMFKGCKKLKTLNLDKFNTGKVTNMCNMFEECGVEELDLRSFDFSGIESTNKWIPYLACMFEESSVKTIKFGDPSTNINCTGMFFGADNLINVTFKNIQSKDAEIVKELIKNSFTSKDEGLTFTKDGKE